MSSPFFGGKLKFTQPLKVLFQIVNVFIFRWKDSNTLHTIVWEFPLYPTYKMFLSKSRTLSDTYKKLFLRCTYLLLEYLEGETTFT